MPIGEDALSNAWNQGLETLRAANAGELAMDAPPIQPAEAPTTEQAAEQPSYTELLNQQAALSEGRGASQDMEMSRLGGDMSDIQRNVIRHAQADMAANPAASHDKKTPSAFQRFLEKRKEWAAEQPSFTGQLAAMRREGIKDIRQTINESYFGKSEHMPEAGTPLNPTQPQVTVEQGNFHGYSDLLDQAAQRGRNEPDSWAVTVSTITLI